MLLKGGQASKFQKHDFEIILNQKGQPSGSTFWLDLETPDPYVWVWGHTNFWAHARPKKSKMADKAQKRISHDQSIDNSLLSSHEKLKADWSKNGWVMGKKRMPLCGIIGIFKRFFAYNSANFQYFSMRPSLFDNYCQNSYSLQASAEYLLKGGFYIQKTSKNVLYWPYLNLRFCLNHCRSKA